MLGYSPEDYDSAGSGDVTGVWIGQSKLVELIEDLEMTKSAKAIQL